MKKSSKRNDVLTNNYSMISGRLIYKFNREIVDHNLFKTLVDEGKYAPVLRLTLDNNLYWVKRIRYVEDELVLTKDISVYKHYIDLIKMNPNLDCVLWPTDIVALSDDVLDLSGKAQTVARHYNVRDEANKVDVSIVGLLFRYKPEYETFKFTAQDIVDFYTSEDAMLTADPTRKLNYTNPIIRKLAVEFVKIMEAVQDAGLIYYDLSLKRFSITANSLGMFLDFSNLVYPVNKRQDITYIEEDNEIDFDYVDPFYYKNMQTEKFADMQSFNVSIASLLFYLFYGRKAYEGGSESVEDTSPLTHRRLTIERLKNPYFVFDSCGDDKNPNKLGFVSSQEKEVEFFKKSDSMLRDAFIKTLSYENVMRINKSSANESEKHYLTPKDWLNIFDELGWIEESKQTRLIIPGRT